MGAFAVFGIENDGLNLAVNLLLLFLVVIWLALIYWTFADARRRIDDPLLVGCATAASRVPVRRHDRLPDRAPARVPRGRARARARDRGRRGAPGHPRALHCQYCGFEVEKDFLRCPSCLRRLQGAVHGLRQAARPALEDLPLLRGRGGPGRARGAPAPHPARGHGRRGAAAPGAQRSARAAARGAGHRAREPPCRRAPPAAQAERPARAGARAPASPRTPTR